LAEAEATAILHGFQDQKQEDITWFILLGRGKHWVSESGVGILGMEEIPNWTHSENRAFSFDFNLQKHFKIRQCITNQKALVCFSD